MLKVENLTFEVNEEGRKRCLVNHVSFQVADGEMLVITGPNGGGKSTLAKVLAGIEKRMRARFFWMMKIFPVMISTTVPMRASVTRFSSRRVLRV